MPGWLQNISARSAPYGQKSSRGGRGGNSRFGGRDYRQDRGGSYGGGGGGYGGGGGGFGGHGGYGAPCKHCLPTAMCLLASLGNCCKSCTMPLHSCRLCEGTRPGERAHS